MHDRRWRRRGGLTAIALLLLGMVACDADVGVGVAVPVHSGWGSRPEGGYTISGNYVGGPAYP